MKTRISLLLILSLLVWAPVHAANVAIMTSVFSPGATVKLESNGELTNVRHPVPLPSSPFSLTTGEGDMVQVQLRDGSYVRLAPHSSAKFTPLMDRVAVLSGTALIYFPDGASLHVADFRMQGNNSVAMLTVDPAETRLLPLSGSVDFLGDRVREGHIEVSSQGRNSDLGPTDLDRVKAESPLLVDLPGSPSLADILTPSKTGLRATINTLNTNARHEAEMAPQEIAQSKFFGPNIANREGSSAIISDILQAQAPISAGTLINPEQTFAQITQNAINSRPLPPLPPISTAVVAPPPPPPATQLQSFAGNWSVNAVGVISDGVGPLTLAPFTLSGGVAYYSVTTLTDNAHTFSLGGSAAFIAAGGKGLDFTATGAINLTGDNSAGGGGGFGGLTLSLNSTGAATSVANVTTTGGAVSLGGKTGVTTTGNIITTGANGGATTAGQAGGAVAMTSSTGNVSVGGAVTANGGVGGAAAGATNAGAGGAGGAISLTATQGTVTGVVNLTSTGGAGGTSAGAATRALGLTTGGAGSGGAGGAITAQAGGGGGGNSIVLGVISSTGGASGALTGGGGTFGLTGSGGAGGNVTLGTTAAPGNVTVTSISSTGGAGDSSAAAKLNGGLVVGGVVAGDGGAGGNITINTSSAFNATVAGATGQVGSVGGTSAAHTDVSQIVSKGGDGGTITVTAGSIGTTGHAANTPQFFSQGGNGGLTAGSFASPNLTEKGGMGGNGGAVSITTTGVPLYAPNIASIGGNAGNTETTGGFSQVFNGVGGMGGNLNISTATGALDLSDTGGANIGSRGGSEVAAGAHGGSTSNGLNVNGPITINVGNNNLTISSATAISSLGNGTAAGYNRFANGGLGQSTTLNSGVLTITSGNLSITDGGAGGVGVVNAGGSSVVINSTGNVNIDDAAARRNTLAGLSGNTTPAIQAIGGVTIANATSAIMNNGTANAPSIWNTGGTVNIDVSHGPGGAVVLGSNSIFSGSTAPSFSSVTGTPGNITITGSGLTQLNGQLFGVSAAPLAGIASGAITVNKTVNGSTIDVGSAGRYGDPNAYVPAVPAYGAVASPSGGGSSMTPSYTVYAQNGNAKVVGPPIIVLSSAVAQTVTPPPPLAPTQSPVPKGNLTPPPNPPQYTRPFDDAQGGTILITNIQNNGSGTPQVIQPLMVGMLGGNAPAGPALHNFTLAPTNLTTATPLGNTAPQFLAVTTVARQGIAGGVSDSAAPAGAPAAPILPAAGTTVIVASQSGVTINR